MLTGDLIDTVLNVLTFAFIGAMAWIWLRKPAGGGSNPEKRPEE
ncbi:MAG: hypothetical protein AB8B58_07955 [Roseobacter sp.]